MSPQIATIRPAMRPLWRLIVSASSKAWVGCSCVPSPALITAASTICASRFGAPGLVVAHHQQVAMHGVQRGRGVDQRLALVHRGRGDRHVDHVGAEPLAGQLEAGAGAGAVLEEQIDQRAPAQQVALRLAGAVEQHIALGEVEQLADRGRFQPFDRQKMFLPVEHDASLQQHGWGVNSAFCRNGPRGWQSAGVSQSGEIIRDSRRAPLHPSGGASLTASASRRFHGNPISSNAPGMSGGVRSGTPLRAPARRRWMLSFGLSIIVYCSDAGGAAGAGREVGDRVVAVLAGANPDADAVRPACSSTGSHDWR